MSEKKFKILLFNIWYCTWINWALSQYFFKFYKYAYINKRSINVVIDKFKSIIEEEKPDLICLIEINKWVYFKHLLNDDYSFFDIETKYGKKSFLRRTPFFRKKSSAFVSNSDLEFKKHYLKYWVKKLFYEIILPWNISFVFWHFSLNKRTRNKQFNEISNINFKNKNIILWWDFNIFKWLWEIKHICNKMNLDIVSSKATFPSIKPKYMLDLFLTSKNIESDYKIIKTNISDHLPVILEIL